MLISCDVEKIQNFPLYVSHLKNSSKKRITAYEYKYIYIKFDLNFSFLKNLLSTKNSIKFRKASSNWTGNLDILLALSTMALWYVNPNFDGIP